jgi:hypothetical protein
MPESKSRKEFEYKPPPKKAPGPPRLQTWVAPTMVVLLVLGLAWVVVYYVSESKLPIESLGDWNLLVGLGMIAAGCVVATKWR